MTQPSHVRRSELELLYLGEATRNVTQHAEGCEGCRRSLSALEAQRDHLLQRHPADAYVRSLRREHERQRERQRSLHAVWGALAVAAIGMLFLARVSEPSMPSELALNGSGERYGGSEVPASLTAAGGDGLIAKGESALTVIRKRGNDVRVLQGPVTLQPRDEIRLRFVLPRAQAISAGVMTDAGTWLPLFEGEFSAGAHTPTATLRVTEEPGGGVVLLGAPEDVLAARSGKGGSAWRAPLLWSPSGDAPPHP